MIKFRLVSTDSRRSLRALFWAVLLQASYVCLTTTPARAAFSLTFRQANWTLLANGSQITAPQAFQYSCGDEETGFTSNCFVSFQESGTAVFIGEIPEEQGKQTAWVSAQPGIDYPQGYYVNFKMSFLGDESADSYAYYKIGNNILGTIGNGDEIAASQLVAFNQTLTFAIYNGAAVNSPGQLTITSFTASPVPAPLPVAGAASAFAFSRRLRRRLKGEGRRRWGRQLAASHPAAYLQLPPATLQEMTVSFSYGVLPRLACSGSHHALIRGSSGPGF